MSSKTKIVVLRMKEIVYTAIFLGLALFLIALCFIMFRPGKSREESAAAAAGAGALYVPGVYSASLALGSENVNVEVTVGSESIGSISLVPLSEAVTTMYPLMQPTLDTLAEQILSTQSTENLTWPESSHYTSTVLIGAINTALDKARVQ